MSRRQATIAVAVFCVALVAGCRVDPYMEVREREWRRLEDEIYYRESVIADLEAQLDSCRRENDALRGRSGNGNGERTEPLPIPSGDENDIVPPEELKDFTPPKTDLGTEAPPPLGQVPPPRRRANLLPVNHEATTSTATTSSGEPNAAALTQTANCGPPVTLALNRRITGGNDTDGCFGDEGILAVVEARDAAGQLVPAPGAMTVVLHDPMASGDRGVIAEWNFTAHEVAERFRAGPFGAGVNFDLPWPNRPPQRSLLRLEVRCLTPDGKTLATTRKISVDLRDSPSSAQKLAPSATPTSSPMASTDTLPPWRPTRE
jgi:hypothetical protein